MIWHCFAGPKTMLVVTTRKKWGLCWVRRHPEGCTCRWRRSNVVYIVMTSCHQAERLARLLITCLSCFVTASWKYSHTGPPAVPSAVRVHWQGVWTCRLNTGSMTLHLRHILKYLHSHYFFKRWKTSSKVDAVFWDLIPYNLVEIYHCFCNTHCLPV
jgi:hypothetical protein